MRFSKDHQPKKRGRRGKDERTKILEALEAAGDSEEGFYQRLVEAAQDQSSDIHQFAIKEVKEGLQPKTKPTLPLVDFDIDKDLSPLQQCEQINSAAAEGLISVDIATQFVTNITNMMKIKDVTDLEERIKKLEGQ